jgi:hypothetical protein
VAISVKIARRGAIYRRSTLTGSSENGIEYPLV